MVRALQIAHLLLILTVAVAVGFLGFAGWRVSKTADALTASVNHSGAVLDSAAQALDTINRPCGGGKPCGTLETIQKTVVKIGDAVVTTQLAERTSTPHVIAAMDTFKDAAVHLSGTADSLSGTATALTGAATAATATIGTAGTTIAAMQPVLGAFTASGNDLDALLKRKAVTDLLDNLAGATGQGNAIMGDFRQVADKARADYLRPVPWWQQPIKRPSQIIDIGAAIARNTP